MTDITITEKEDKHLVLSEESNIETVVVTETDDSTNTVVVESEPDKVVVVQSTAPDQLMVTHGGSVYRTAVEGGFTGTEVEWISEIFDSKASIRYVTEVFSSEQEARSRDIMEMEARVGDTYATLVDFYEAYANSEEARATMRQEMEANFQDEISSTYTNLTQAIANEQEARSSQIETWTATFEDNYATNESVSLAVSTATSALAQNIETLATNVEDNYATNTSVSTAITTATTALSQNIDSLAASVENNYATLDTVNTAFADERSAWTNQLEIARSEIESGVNSSLTTFSNTLAEQDQARAQMGQQLTADLNNGISSTINRIDTVESTLTASIATVEQTLQADFENEVGQLSTSLNERIDTVESNAEGALASTEERLRTEFDDNIGGLSTALNERIDTVESNAEQSLASTEERLSTEFTTNINTVSNALSEQINTVESNAETALASAEDRLSTSFDDGLGSLSTSLNERIDTVESNADEAIATSESTLRTEFETELGTVNSVLNERIDTARSDADSALSSAVSTLKTDFETDLGQVNSALNDRIDTARSDAESALSSAVSTLTTDFESELGSVNSALNERIDTAESTASEAVATARSELSTEIEGVGSAVNKRIDSVSTDVEGNTSTISEVKGQIEDPNTGLSAAYSLAQSAKSTADGAVESTTLINNRIDGITDDIDDLDSDFAEALLGLETTFNAETNRLSSMARLAVNVNNEVTGFFAEGDNSGLSKLSLRGDSIEILPTTGNNPLLSVDTVNNRLDLRARLILNDGHVVSDLDDIRAQDGKDGVPGEPGKDGKVFYTWIRYADYPDGSGFSNEPDGKNYIGFAYNKETPVESDDPSEYMWSKIKGEHGVPGAPGEDGETTYTWIAYSDYSDGTDMYQIPNEDTKYIGIAVNKTTLIESSDPSDYVWSRFRGEDGKDGVDGADGKDGSDGASARAVKLTASRQAVKYNATGSSPIPSSITFTAQAQNTTGTVRYRFFVNDTAQGSAGTSNTFTYPVPSSLPNEPISVEVELHEDGVIKARDEVTVYGLKDGSSAVSVIISNQAHTVPSDPNGGNPDLTGSGTDVRVFQGTTPLIFDGLQTGHPSQRGRFRIGISSSTGMSFPVASGVGTDTATIGDYTAMTVDLATVDLRIRAVTDEGEALTIPEVLSYSKSRRGADGKDGKNGVDGADGADGSDGANARAVHLSATRQAVKYNTAGSNPTPSTITFTAQAQNTTGSVRYRFFVNNSAQGSASTSNTFTYSAPSSLFSTPISVEVELHEDGVIKARDEVSVYGIQDGTNAISVVVSNQAHTVPANADGSNPDLTGSGTTIKVFEGSTPLVYDGVSTSYPSLPRRFSITRTSDGMSTANLSGSGTTTATVADYTTMWGSRDKTSVTFTIRVRNSAGEDVEPITVVTTFSKSRKGDKGDDGRDGQSTYKSVVYQRNATKPSRPPNSIAAGGSYENPVPAFWSASLPAHDGNPGWQSTRIFTSNGASPQEPEWSEPQQITGDDGTPGAPGTGFYSAQYDSLNWGVARGRFRDLVGRWPIPGDVFTMSLANGNSETRKRNEADDSWVAPGIMLHGDMFATGTVGARVLSADAVNGRVIHGSLYITSTPSSEYFEVQGILPNTTAFGAQNNLYMWYGRKTSQTWNSSTNEPRLNGLSTLNSIEHKTTDGGRFFGGTFQVGSLSLSRQTTNKVGQMVVQTGPFTVPSNVTTLSIASSASINAGGFGVARSCPLTASYGVVVDIERERGSSWDNIGGTNNQISRVCRKEGSEIWLELSGGASATTQISVTPGQVLNIRAVASAPALPFDVSVDAPPSEPQVIRIDGSRSLSIAIAGN